MNIMASLSDSYIKNYSLLYTILNENYMDLKTDAGSSERNGHDLSQIHKVKQNFDGSSLGFHLSLTQLSIKY